MKYASRTVRVRGLFLLALIVLFSFGYLWFPQTSQAVQRQTPFNKSNTHKLSAELGPRLFLLSAKPDALLPPLTQTIRFHATIPNGEQTLYLTSGTAEDETTLMAAGLVLPESLEISDTHRYFLVTKSARHQDIKEVMI